MELHLRHNNNNKAEASGSEATAKNATKADPNQANSRTSVVVFIGLLMDLLAFTLILPLFPALLDHYKKHDSEAGLYPYLVSHSY
jgi:hypothetical protein